MAKQKNIFDFPTQKYIPRPKLRKKKQPKKKVERPPDYTYIPKHRERTPIIFVTPEQAADSKEMRRKGIEYHQNRSDR